MRADTDSPNKDIKEMRRGGAEPTCERRCNPTQFGQKCACVRFCVGRKRAGGDTERRLETLAGDRRFRILLAARVANAAIQPHNPSREVGNSLKYRHTSADTRTCRPGRPGFSFLFRAIGVGMSQQNYGARCTLPAFCVRTDGMIMTPYSFLGATP